jgi:hypothetical protein
MMIETKGRHKNQQKGICSELGLSAQSLKLERSTPVVTANLKTLFKRFLDLCEFNASTMNLLELTGLPQMNQNSEFITSFTTFWKCL